MVTAAPRPRRLARAAPAWARAALALLTLTAGAGSGAALAQDAASAPPAATLPGAEIWTDTGEGRAALFDLVAERVEALYWDPDALDWRAWRERHRDAVVGASDAGAMDEAFRRMFRDLGDDHSRWLGREDEGSGPSPAEPTPADPAPVGPAPAEPGPTGPGRTDPAPDEPTPPDRESPVRLPPSPPDEPAAPDDGPIDEPVEAPHEPPTRTPPEPPADPAPPSGAPSVAPPSDGPARLGAETRPLEGRGLLVLRVHPGGAAEAAGLRRGDVITATAGGSLGEPSPDPGGFGMRARIARALREGATTLTVERPEGSLAIRLEPRPLPPGAEERPQVQRTSELDAARLEIPAFAPGAAAAAHEELDRLEGEGVDALVIDLRGNPGGSVAEMGLVLGAFLEGEPLRSLARDEAAWTLRIERGATLDVRLVRDGGRLAGRDLSWARLGSFATWEGDVAVLVDGGTASAAEAFAGALAAAGRAVVVGEPTPGNVETIRRIAFPAGRAAMVAVGDLRAADGEVLAPVPLDAEATLDPAALARGSDAPYAEAVRRLRGLPVTPGRWF